MNKRIPFFFENLMDGLLYYFKFCFAAEFVFDIFEDLAGVLDRLVIEIEQRESGIIAYLVLDEEFLDFYGRSAAEVKNPSGLAVVS